ncbi:MAG: hypothetical protein PHS45_05345, partial [Bacilli bacterium]|nr:hypothetical protein [Bacilli bacterium]
LALTGNWICEYLIFQFIIGDKRIEIFDYFIKSKYNYLRSIDYNIEEQIILKLKEHKFIK